MKHKSILSLLIFLMGLGVTTTSCEDMLTPDMTRYADDFTGRDTVYFYLGIVRNVQDMVEQNKLLGDLRSDLVATTQYSSDSISHIIDYNKTDKDGDNALLNRAAYYKVINQCNFYLAKCDTNAMKNNIYYMRREYAQVVNIRAWTYLQLVQTYGKVPFVTKPVDNANTGWETNPDTWATADNLVDLLRSDLEKANAIESELGYPQYGTYQSGNSSFTIASRYLCFYSDLVLGDLYLLRGQNRSDYVNAAKSYYHFLYEQSRNGRGGTTTSNLATFGEGKNSNGSSYYTPSVSSWVGSGLAASALTTENITIIPSAANSSFGRVLTRNTQVYGFDTHSTNSTSDDATTTGSISITSNYKSRQVQPSEGYLQLCQSQNYSYTETDRNGVPSDVKYYTGAGDARVHATSPYFQTKEGRMRFIVKDAPVTYASRYGETTTGDFKHFKTLYRTRQVYLRLAEAINRAGYPRMAYAILRNGVSKTTIPVLTSSDTIYNDELQTRTPVYKVDSTTNLDIVRAAYFIGVDELRRAQADPDFSKFLDYSSNYFSGNYGIHEFGCGTTSSLDSLNGYEIRVAQRMADEQLRAGGTQASVAKIVKRLRAETNEGATDTEISEEDAAKADSILNAKRQNYEIVEPEVPAEPADLAEQVNAVETLIADECALETAFEGSRMFDLIRFARHKNNDANLSADYGTTWLAWLISRRDKSLAPYENPTETGSLYGTLLNPDNWYIVNPVY